MEDPTDAKVIALSRQHPDWQVWVVHRVYGGNVWCARRHDNHKVVINAGSPDELGAMIGDREWDQAEEQR